MRNWQCPVCDGKRSRVRWQVSSTDTENGVDPERFRPSADRYGETIGTVLTCLDCGHGSLAVTPTAQALAAAYSDAADPVSLDEEAGQLETASRALARIERHVSPGVLVDIGCWTGSFVAAAVDRGWQACGVEPSRWAVERALERGLDVTTGSIDEHHLPPAGFRAVVMCDVIEHLLDVRHAVRELVNLLEPDGVLYLTTPDASGSLARAMGSRWWSILPMHVQYFTRQSITRLLQDAGLDVLEVDAHPKVFTARYYANRLGGYSPSLARAVTGTLARVHLDERLVGPDLRDRMQIVARKPRTS